MFVAAVTSLLMAESETKRRIAEDLLRDANRRKDEFLAMLAHELRNPLAPIRNAVEVIRASKSDAGRLNWACNVMVRQIQHMSRLTRCPFVSRQIRRPRLFRGLSAEGNICFALRCFARAGFPGWSWWKGNPEGSHAVGRKISRLI